MGKIYGQVPRPEVVRALAGELIQGQSTFTLATCRSGEAWAAPIYYVFHLGAFHFFSDPTSRHVREALDAGRAAASLYEDGEGWRGIRGLQMEGRVEALGIGPEALKVVAAYLRRFPFVRDLLRGESADLEGFQKRFRSRLYRFVPERTLYMDNRFGLGFRVEVSLR